MECVNGPFRGCAIIPSSDSTAFGPRHQPSRTCEGLEILCLEHVDLKTQIVHEEIKIPFEHCIGIY